MSIQFTKMHGLGNDFVVIEDLDCSIEIPAETIAWLCDRNLGIGGDGLILVRPATSAAADYFMLYHNADGSKAEMCGNGVRCFAKYLVDHSLVDSSLGELRVETLGGIKPIRFELTSAGLMDAATVDMGKPRIISKDISDLMPEQIASDYSIETPYGEFTATAVSMGNPHAVIWVDDIDKAPVTTVGPIIENSSIFPLKTNVEFAQVVGIDRIRLRVWERGVGETLACGTGACATLVAASLADRVGRSATVELPGGELFILWDTDDHIHMTGPATEVFSGTINLQ